MRGTVVETVGRVKDLSRRMPIDAIFTRLADELPSLPVPKQTVRLPAPRHVEDLIQQPQTIDEKLDELADVQAKAAAKASAKSLARPGTQPQGPAAHAPPKKGRKLVVQKAWGNQKEVPFGERCWYAKRPDEPKVIVPLQYQVDGRADNLERMEQTIETHRRRMAPLAGPVTGWVLRMTLINEPLRAPPCQESDEVSTLIETALTSRRLRNYD